MTVSLLHSVPADGSFSAAGAAAWDAQHVFTQATDRLLGRTTAGVGATEEISVGAGLTLSGGTLVNAGATSPIGGSDTQVQFNDGGVFAGNANFTFNKTTNQIAIAAGTAAAPTLIPTGDTNTGMWFPAADTIALSTGGTERMRIASTGNITLPGQTTIAGKWVFATTGNLSASSTDSQLPQITITNQTDNALGSSWTTIKSRGGTTPATTNDQIGRFGFTSYTTGGTPSIAAQLVVNSAGASAGGHAANFVFSTRNTSDVFAERFRINSEGNLGLGTSTFGTSAATVFAIATGTAPTTGPANTIQIYSTDLSAGNTMLSLYTEGTVVNANTTAATTHRIAIRVNGTVYYLLANTAA